MNIFKGIALFLVLANVGFFLWARGVGDAEPTTLASASPMNLKLVAEDPSRADTPSQPAPGADSGLPLPAAGSGPANPAAAATSPTAPATPAMPAVPAAAGVLASNDAAAGAAAANASAGNAAAGGGAPGAPASGKHCATVGPFADVTQASHAAATLRSLGYDPRSRVAEGDVWAGIWVYLPLPAAPSAGPQVLASLKRGGIDDALEMPGPNDAPVISLGLFSEPRRAQARVEQAHALGFNPGIADRKRTGDVYWLDVDLKPADGPPNVSNLQGEAGRVTRLESKPCPSSPAP